ncbi:hypothetical protein DRJ58_05945, partial [Candidatus Acetothermia bacterium]
DIPLLSVRVRIAREVGKALLAFGSARAFFAVGSCAELVERVAAHIPSFRDACLYRATGSPSTSGPRSSAPTSTVRSGGRAPGLSPTWIGSPPSPTTSSRSSCELTAF